MLLFAFCFSLLDIRQLSTTAIRIPVFTLSVSSLISPAVMEFNVAFKRLSVSFGAKV